MILGFGVIAACVLYTGFDLAMHGARSGSCFEPESPEESAARDLMMTEMDFHLGYMAHARNAVARRYGFAER